MKKAIFAAILLASFSFAQTPNVSLMYETSRVLQGALDAVTGISNNTTVYIPGYGLVLVFEEIGRAEAENQGAGGQFGGIVASLYDTIQGVPESEWITFYWTQSRNPEDFTVLLRLKQNNPETFEVWVNGERAD